MTAVVATPGSSASFVQMQTEVIKDRFSGTAGLAQSTEAGTALDVAYAAQFGVVQSGLVATRSITVTATGLLNIGSSVLIRAACSNPGSANRLKVYNAQSAIAANQIMDLDFSAMAADQDYYPVLPTNRHGALINDGLYVEVPTGGVFTLDFADAPVDGVLPSGVLATPIYVSATGLLVDGNGAGGPWNVVSAYVIDKGTAGNLAFDQGTSADANARRGALRAYTSLTNGDSFDIGGYYSQMYVTVPTGGIVVVWVLPR